MKMIQIQFLVTHISTHSVTLNYQLQKRKVVEKGSGG